MVFSFLFLPRIEYNMSCFKSEGDPLSSLSLSLSLLRLIKEGDGEWGEGVVSTICSVVLSYFVSFPLLRLYL